MFDTKILLVLFFLFADATNISAPIEQSEYLSEATNIQTRILLQYYCSRGVGTCYSIAAPASDSNPWRRECSPARLEYPVPILFWTTNGILMVVPGPGPGYSPRAMAVPSRAGPHLPVIIFFAAS
jgi:hypothetical protein